MTVSLSLSRKVARVNGGSRGIGGATVRMFVAAGARVAFSYEKARESARRLVTELGAENCAAIARNLSGTETAPELVAAAISRFGRFDILVANHGVWRAEDAPIDLMSDRQWRGTLAVNLDGVFALVKHSVVEMKGRERPPEREATSCWSAPPWCSAETLSMAIMLPRRAPGSAW